MIEKRAEKAGDQAVVDANFKHFRVLKAAKVRRGFLLSENRVSLAFNKGVQT
jgi:hypothetical protein